MWQSKILGGSDYGAWGKYNRVTIGTGIRERVDPM